MNEEREMNAKQLETENLRLKLIETQMALLQYQHRDVSADIARLHAVGDVGNAGVKGD